MHQSTFRVLSFRKCVLIFLFAKSLTSGRINSFNEITAVYAVESAGIDDEREFIESPMMKTRRCDRQRNLTETTATAFNHG